MIYNCNIDITTLKNNIPVLKSQKFGFMVAHSDPEGSHHQDNSEACEFDTLKSSTDPQCRNTVKTGIRVPTPDPLNGDIFKKDSKELHIEAVRKAVANYPVKMILNSRPPPMNTSEVFLAGSTRTKLSQGYAPADITY